MQPNSMVGVYCGNRGRETRKDRIVSKVTRALSRIVTQDAAATIGKLRNPQITQITGIKTWETSLRKKDGA